MNEDESELEAARKSMHKKRTPEAVAFYKQSAKRVARRRQAERRDREAAGPPEGAAQVRDAAGQLLGYTTPTGDAVATPGSTA
jgi:hypothetical protein